jgi:isopenicillin N synthase-like dioxygenase
VAEILEVDLLRFEQGDAAARAAVVDGVRRSLATGFVYTSHDLPEEVIDEAYAKPAEFFSLAQDVKEKFIVPGSHGQTGYTGLLVETAASAEVPDWKEMLNWSDEPPAGHRGARRHQPHHRAPAGHRRGAPGEDR